MTRMCAFFDPAVNRFLAFGVLLLLVTTIPGSGAFSVQQNNCACPRMLASSLPSLSRRLLNRSGGGGTSTRTILSSTTTSTTNSEEDITSMSEETLNVSATVQKLASAALPAYTFTGKVERCLLQDFGAVEASRVVTSLRLLEVDYEHSEYIGKDDDVDTDAQDPRCFQKCHSWVPGLSIQPFWSTKEVPWAQALEKKYKAIRSEFDSVTARLRTQDAASSQGNNIWAGALTQDASSYGEGWRTLVLMDRGRWDPVNVNLFPVTAKAVRDAGVPAVEVFFASMEPNSTIQPHTDNTNFVLTSHLGLDIPASGNNQCRLTIGSETRQWINGEVLMFDTSIIHDAVNESPDQTRYILMMRIWHPDLREKEREALQFIYDCVVLPDLISNEPEKKKVAQEQAAALKTFPVLEKTKQGFGGSGGGSASGVKKVPKKKGKK